VLTGDDLVDFAVLVCVVKKLMHHRATTVRMRATDARLVLMIQTQCYLLYLLGGPRTLDRAILHIASQIGPSAAAATMKIIDWSGEVGF
jgi:hypothetical protein